MSCCACCCFYPKYKRKVDNIFPRNLDGNLVRNEVDKLQYYSCQHPEKLSKIVDYLYLNLKWGLSGSYKNKNYVKNTVEAVNKILMVISPDYLNFFSIAYLKIIQKLLEQSDLEYQKLAIQSFKKFCEKERYQTTTNFQQRNYDTFVSIFSSMCFNNHNDENVRSEIRISGLQGIGAMVKNLSPDENVLQATYLWENMDKVISGLLYIMQEAYNRLMIQQQQLLQQQLQQQQMPNSSSILTSAKGDLYSRLGPCVNNDETMSTTMDNSKMKEIKLDRIEVSVADNSADESNKFEMRNLSSIYQQQQQQLLNGDKERLEPCLEAELLLKEISIKSDFTTIIRVITPILKYMDNNKGSGWQQSEFVKKVFQTLMNNVKQQHSIIIKELMKHLDSHRNSDPIMKSSIIRVISMCIQISALYSIGTNAQIIEIFTSLLKQLNLSLEKSLSIPQGGKGQQQQQSLSPTAALVASINDSGLSRNTTDSVRDQEIRFQHEILNAMKNFTSQLPDYAKNDVIMYLTRQINSHQFNYTDNLNNADTQQRRARDNFNEQLRNKYLDALFEICTKYKSTQLFAAFTSAPILEDILKLTLINDPQSRRKTHEILHYLLDKNQNIDKLRQFQEEQKSRLTGTTAIVSKYRSMVDLFSVTLPHRDDVHFMRKYGRLFLSHITEAVFIKNNTKANYEAALITLLLFVVGICDEEFLPELINFGFHIQELALINYNELNIEQKCSIHALLTVYFDMLCKLYPAKTFADYVCSIIWIRKSDQYRKYLYPDYAYTDIKEGGSKFIGNGIGSTTLSAKDIEFDKEYDLISEEFSLAIKCQCDSDKDSGINEQLNLRTINVESLGKNSKLDLDSSWLFDKNRVFEAFSDRKFKDRPTESYSLSSAFINNSTYKTSLTFRSIAGFVYQNSLSKQGSESNLSLNRFNNDVNPTRGGNNNGHRRNNTATSINKPNNGDDAISIASSTYDYSISSSVSVDDVRIAENRDLKFFIENGVDSNDQTITPQSTVDIALKRANLQTTLRSDGVLAFDTIRTILTNPKVQFSTSNYVIKDDNNNSNGINSTDAVGSVIQQNGGIQQNNEMNNFEKQKALNDFKQKTFEEVKYDLNNYNHVNKDKFNKVLEFINTNSTNASTGNSNNPTDSSQANYVPLNNIEFPRVFLY